MRRFRGFTLIETMLVLLLLALILTPALEPIQRAMDKMRINATTKKMEKLKAGLQEYFRRQGLFPVKTQGLSALQVIPSLAPIPASWHGPYTDLGNVTLDDFGNALSYVTYKSCSSTCVEFTATDTSDLYNLYQEQTVKLISSGTDGVFKTSDDIAISFSNTSIVQDLYGPFEYVRRQLQNIMTVAAIRVTDSTACANCGSTYFTYLTSLATAGAAPCSASRPAQINQFSGVIGVQGTYDYWGNTFLWNAVSSTFYSAGPVGIDYSCNGALSTSNWK